METLESVDAYRSPTKKLVQFFRSSRDRWKRKCRSAKDQLKLAGNQVRAVEKSRESWRQQFLQEQRKTKQLERELAELKRALARAR